LIALALVEGGPEILLFLEMRAKRERERERENGHALIPTMML